MQSWQEMFTFLPKNICRSVKCIVEGCTEASLFLFRHCRTVKYNNDIQFFSTMCHLHECITFLHWLIAGLKLSETHIKVGETNLKMYKTDMKPPEIQVKQYETG